MNPLCVDVEKLNIPRLTDGNWFAVRVRSNYEKLTAQALDYRGVRCFLPVYKVRRQWTDRIKVVELPLFSGYVFCHVADQRFVPILESPGVVRVVGNGATPVPVDAHEMDALRRIVASGEETIPWPYLAKGQRVRLRTGALKGVEGLLASVDGRERVIVNIDLLQRSVAVSVERMDLEPIWPQ